MPASIFAGSKVKTLKSTLSLNGGADIISSTTNPQTSAVSAEPGSLLLNTTSGTMYRKLDSGSTTNWVEVGAGTGGKNYIKNPDFDGGATTSWSMQKVSLSSFIPTGNIGAADAGHTIATSGSSPLEGANSLLVQGASAFTAGNCLVSAAFTIDREDVAKVMGWSFSYEAITTNMDFSGTTANTWAVYIAEVTTGTPDTVVSWIQPAGVYNLVQGSGVGLAAGTFQTTATESSAYRIVLVCINSEAAATTLKVDDFQLGPQRVVYGSPVTDWQSFTPTVSGISGTMTGKWRRIGDSAEFEMALTTSGTASGTITVSVTSAFAFDYTKLPVSAFANIGSAAANDGTGLHLGTCFTDNTSTNSFFISGDDGQNVWNATVPFTWSGTRTVSFSVKVPLAGLSSSVQMSNDTDTRVVSAQAACSTAFAYSATTPINFDTVVVDRSGSVSPSATAWKFTAPVSGDYRVSTNLLNGTGAISVNLYKNGSLFRQLMSVTTAAITSASTTISLNAGEYIDIRGASAATLVAGLIINTISVERLSGPATIAASETVAARYGLNAATNITNGVVINYAQKDYDYTNSVTTGASWRFTAPISGLYEVSVLFYAGPATSGTINQEVGVRLSKNGIAVQYIYIDPAKTTSSVLKVGNGSTRIKLLAGEYIEIIGYNATGITHTAAADPTLNYVEITRIGN
jgi:hypothetical protein